jgi:preprotein translocase subunit SecA
MNNNMDPNETRAFVSLRESLVKSIGEDGFKRLCNLSVLCDNNKKEKFKNEMKTKFIQEHKTKTEITNELKKIDQFYSYGEPL